MIEVLSKSLTKLMESPETPESPIEFIRENMGLSQKLSDQVEFLKEEVVFYKNQVDDLKKEIAGLKLERRKLLSKETANDSVVVESIIENQNNENNNGESETMEVSEPIQVLENGKTIEDNQKVDILNFVEPEVIIVEGNEW